MKKKYIIDILIVISLILNTFRLHAIDLKPFLSGELYEKVARGQWLSMLAYNLLLFILLYEDVFSKEKEYSNIQKVVYFIAFIGFFVACCWF